MINPHLPQPASLRCRQIIIDPSGVTIVVETTTPTGLFQICGRPSGRIHSRYTRMLADLPWQCRIVRWCLEVRKFFCDTPDCSRRVFTERLANVADVHARKATRLDEALTGIAFACGGEGGSRLAGGLGMPTSPDTLLRRIRRASSSPCSTPRVLGVDEWAVRRGQEYGAILCDLEARHPVNLLEERSAESFPAWLTRHPGVQIISRDRAGCYAQGANTGAPDATQVADRWHLLDNLRKALPRMLDRRSAPAPASACPRPSKPAQPRPTR